MSVIKERGHLIQQKVFRKASVIIAASWSDRKHLRDSKGKTTVIKTAIISYVISEWNHLVSFRELKHSIYPFKLAIAKRYIRSIAMKWTLLENYFNPIKYQCWFLPLISYFKFIDSCCKIAYNNYGLNVLNNSFINPIIWWIL